MSVLILFPTNSDATLTTANVYRADTIGGEYTLIDTADSTVLEYVDSTGDYTKFYKIGFTDLETESTLIVVVPFEKQVIDLVRNLVQIPVVDLADSVIVNLIPTAQHDIRLDICEYVYGEVLVYSADGIYTLPNRYFYDKNNGGAISTLDVDFYLQTIPVYPYSEKTAIIPTAINVDERYIQLSRALISTEQIKMNYYMTRRRIETDSMLTMLVYKIAANHYEEQYTYATGSDNAQKVKIGDITIDTGTKSATLLKDTRMKAEAKYTKLVDNFKQGFYRAKE